MRIAIVSGDDIVDDDPQQLCAALADRGHEVMGSSGTGAADLRE